MNKGIKAFGLLSGGLDSILAIKVIQAQGIEVTGLTFTSPFFSAKAGIKAAEQTGIRLVIKDITDEHLQIVKNPRYGHGKSLNPCIDCHLFMVQKAGEIMQQEGYSFIFTGEVLGERPMSQNWASLDLIARKSGYGQFLLRPLSAKHLPPTEPEINGLVDREKLLDLQGRGRKRQFALAQEFGITEFPTPAGGCLLTDVGFTKRLRDLFTHQPEAPVDDIHRLRIGRHYRFSPTVKIVVGRNQYENDLLDKHRLKTEILVFSPDKPGPYCLISGTEADSFLATAIELCLAYGDGNDQEKVRLMVEKGDEKREVTGVVDRSLRYPEKRI
jgi:tRNA-uridine 2-sulfurtransferase